MPPLYSAPVIADPAANGFRLSLSSGVPVPPADVVAATTIFLTPYTSSTISLFDGSRWVPRDSPQVSFAIGTITPQVYDIFAVWNGSAVVLEIVIWTSLTARATALATQNGVLVKTGDPLRRYVGSFYMTSTTTSEDSKLRRLLYNHYNQVVRFLSIIESTASWVYATAAYRQTRATGTNRFEYVTGDPNQSTFLRATAQSIFNASTGTVSACAGVGIDSTTANSGAIIGGDNTALPACKSTTEYKGYPALGYHAINWLENGNTNVTFFGTNALATIYQSGMTGEVTM